MTKKLHLVIFAFLTSCSVSSFAVNLSPYQTVEIPIANNKDLFCQLRNSADFGGYLFLRPKAGSFTHISYNTCAYKNGAIMCMGASGTKILLGAQNEKINIYGVTTNNLALVVTNYAGQLIDITCN